VPHGSFYRYKWLLNLGTSIYFTLFESDFINMALDNYCWVETANLKVSLFMIVPGIVLIKHKIFDPEKGTTKVFILKI